MGIDIRVYLEGSASNASSLANGNVLKVTAGLGGVIPLLEQIDDGAEQFLSLKNALVAQYGANNVTDNTKQAVEGGTVGQVYYKYVWFEGEGWVRVCYTTGSLLVQFSLSEVVRVDFENGIPYGGSMGGTSTAKTSTSKAQPAAG